MNPRGFITFYLILYSASPQILHRTISALQYSLVQGCSVFIPFYEKEPPPPRSTPWAAYRWHGSSIGISASVHQPGEMHIVSAFTLSHTPFLNNCHQVQVLGGWACSNSTHVIFMWHQSHRHDGTHPYPFHELGRNTGAPCFALRVTPPPAWVLKPRWMPRPHTCFFHHDGLRQPNTVQRIRISLVQCAALFCRRALALTAMYRKQDYLVFWMKDPILGDNPKAHKTSYEKHCGFCEKHCSFHLKSEKHNEQHQKQLLQHRSLIWTWCFIEYRGKANWVYHILVVFGGAHVFGGACMCIWCTYMYL